MKGLELQLELLALLSLTSAGGMAGVQDFCGWVVVWSDMRAGEVCNNRRHMPRNALQSTVALGSKHVAVIPNLPVFSNAFT